MVVIPVVTGCRGVAGDRGGGSYGAGQDMEIQQDTVFITGMDRNVSEDDLAQHFGSIGIIKVWCGAVCVDVSIPYQSKLV